MEIERCTRCQKFKMDVKIIKELKSKKILQIRSRERDIKMVDNRYLFFTGTEQITEEEDVTKSIYEMYYKNKPKIRLKYRNSEEDQEDHKYAATQRYCNLLYVAGK